MIEKCDECGSNVEPHIGPGRAKEYSQRAQGPRVVWRNIPDDFCIPTCLGCKKIFLTEELSKKLDSILLPHAAAILLTRGDKVLGVSRKDNFNQFGLVGGKVDPGETDSEAAIREALEETGLHISNLRAIFAEADDNEYWTTVYLADYSDEINTSEKGVVKWVDWDTLFNGPFGKFNRRLHKVWLKYADSH